MYVPFVTANLLTVFHYIFPVTYCQLFENSFIEFEINERDISISPQKYLLLINSVPASYLILHFTKKNSFPEQTLDGYDNHNLPRSSRREPKLIKGFYSIFFKKRKVFFIN